MLERAYYGKDYEGEGPLSGRELALLCYGKYGVYHDMAVKHVKMGGGMQRWVSLNLYVGHLGQRSYPSTETQYVEQMDAIAYMVTQWGQADFTRAFFPRETSRAKRFAVAAQGGHLRHAAVIPVPDVGRRTRGRVLYVLRMGYWRVNRGTRNRVSLLSNRPRSVSSCCYRKFRLQSLVCCRLSEV